MFRADTAKKQKEPDYTVKDPRALRLNLELAALKEKCGSDGLNPEATLDQLIAHAAEGLSAEPDLARTHRFSWISGKIELRLTPDKD